MDIYQAKNKVEYLSYDITTEAGEELVIIEKKDVMEVLDAVANSYSDIQNVSVLSELKEWCFDNCNESNSDGLYEILDRLDKR